VAKITEKPDGNLILRYEDIEHGGKIAEAEYDLVVLAIGVQPNLDPSLLFDEGILPLDDSGYVSEPNEDIDPGITGVPGVFVAGAVSGAKDISESILHAESTAAQVAAHLERLHGATCVNEPALVAAEVRA
jgi:heterodisulfide reductase subunit A